MRDRLDDDLTGADAILKKTTAIIAAYVSNNPIEQAHLPDLIRSVHQTLESLSKGEQEKISDRPKPAVPINKSITNEYIVCLEDGRKLKMLKRYLRSTYNMSPEEYKKRWNLPNDYPMVAPNYAHKRSEFAKQIGLGKGVRRKEAESE